MHFDSLNPTLKLKPRQIVRITDLSGVRVFCRQGSVWITQDGDLTDTVLERGQTYRSTRAAPLLLYGLGEAEVEVIEPAAAPASGVVRGFERLVSPA